MQRTACPCCGSSRTDAFYEALQVPVNSVLTLRTREEALTFPRGDIVLRSCRACGFVFNGAFDASLVRYEALYEETQGYSATFRAFERQLAEDLIRRHGLHGKQILEIGCGKGDFLALLCRLGPNRGVGYDPAFAPERRPAGSDAVRYIPELYDEGNARGDADLIYSKMTLEHIAEPGALLRLIRKAIGPAARPAVAIQVPDWRRILAEQAFWDIYYEHCSYFTAESLASALRACGFAPARHDSLYDGQYVAVEAYPDRGGAEGAAEEAAADRGEIESFQSGANAKLRQLGDALREAAGRGPVALWGGGSKAVSFLASLGVREEVSAVVDINPYRQGTWIAGSGHRISAPEELRRLRPATVFVMNPVYELEIQKTLGELGVEARTAPLG